MIDLQARGRAGPASRAAAGGRQPRRRAAQQRGGTDDHQRAEGHEHRLHSGFREDGTVAAERVESVAAAAPATAAGPPRPARSAVARRADRRAAVGRQQGRRCRRRPSAADEVALQQVAAHGGELPGGGLVLDALGHDAQAEVVTQVDGAADDGGVAGLAQSPAVKLLSILISSTCQPLQVGQRGVPGAEVVDGDLHAHAPAVRRRISALRLGVAHQPALGDLEHQPLAGRRRAAPGAVRRCPAGPGRSAGGRTG